MKRIIALVFTGILIASCSQYSCPTYENYSYSPPKKKAVKYKGSASSKKPVKKAEQD